MAVNYVVNSTGDTIAVQEGKEIMSTKRILLLKAELNLNTYYCFSKPETTSLSNYL